MLSFFNSSSESPLQALRNLLSKEKIMDIGDGRSTDERRKHQQVSAKCNQCGSTDCDITIKPDSPMGRGDYM